MAELEILREVVRICDRHKLRYYLIGGTLLGAVKFKGFIPWDDDIDIGMPRPDYERFSVLCRTELDDRYFWQTCGTEDRFPLDYGKMRLNGTEMVEKESGHLPIHHGISIDIFPFDGAPNPAWLRSLHKWAVKLFKLRLKRGLKHRGFLRSVLALPTALVPRSWAVAWYGTMLNRFVYDQSPLVVNTGTRDRYEKETVPRVWLEGGEEFQFEGLRLRGPKQWDLYLARIFGDYRKTPPENERTGSHGVVLIRFAEHGAGKGQ